MSLPVEVGRHALLHEHLVPLRILDRPAHTLRQPLVPRAQPLLVVRVERAARVPLARAVLEHLGEMQGRYSEM